MMDLVAAVKSRFWIEQQSKHPNAHLAVRRKCPDESAAELAYDISHSIRITYAGVH